MAQRDWILERRSRGARLVRRTVRLVRAVAVVLVVLVAGAALLVVSALPLEVPSVRASLDKG
jgi:hypothetical protein